MLLLLRVKLLHFNYISFFILIFISLIQSFQLWVWCIIGDILPGISVQVQKVIQGLEDNDESQGEAPNLKLEPGTLDMSPKAELQENINFSDVRARLSVNLFV